MIKSTNCKHCVGRAGRATLAASLLLSLGLAAPAAHAATINEDWTGDDGDDWSSQWEFRNAGTNNEHVSIQDNGGNITGRSGTAIVTGLITDGTGTFTDSVQSVNLKIEDSHKWAGGLVAAHDNDSPASYYRAWVYRDAPADPFRLFIDRQLDGGNGVTTLATSSAVNVSTDDYANLTFSVQYVGTEVNLVATYTDAQGNVTQIDATDTAPLPAPNQVGVLAQTSTQVGGFVRFDDYSVAIPEPGTLALAMAGAGLMALPRRRRQRD